MIKKATALSCVLLNGIFLHANQSSVDNVKPPITNNESAAEINKEKPIKRNKNNTPKGHQIQHPNMSFIIQSFTEWPPYVTIIQQAGTAASRILGELNMYHHVEKSKDAISKLIRSGKILADLPTHAREDVLKEIEAVEVANNVQQTAPPVEPSRNENLNQSSSSQPAIAPQRDGHSSQQSSSHHLSTSEQHAIEIIILETYKRSFFEERVEFLAMLHTFRVLLRPIIHEVVERDPQTSAHNSLLLEFLDSDGSHAKTFFYQKITNLNLLQQAGHEFTALCSDLWSSLTHQVKVAYKAWYLDEAKKKQQDEKAKATESTSTSNT